jgi:HlyD family secretion protein
MRLMAITSLVLGSVAVFPATSYLERASTDAGWSVAATPLYVTAPVRAEEVVKTVMATGSLVPSVNVEVGSVLSGQILKLRVDFNDKVTKGQVLAELDDRSYVHAADASRAAMEGAKFEIAGFQARLKRSTLDLWQAEHQLPVFTARVDNAKIALETAERDYKRKLWLQERETATVTDVQNTQSKRDSLAATLREAEANLANQTGLIAGARADVDKARADLAAAQAAQVRLESQWQSAMVDLERTKLTAPIDGVIIGRTVTEGQTLATGLEAKTLFIIAGDLGNMEIDARIDESDIASIKAGQPATFTVDAFPGRTFSATVKQIRMSPQVVSNVVTYTVVLKTTNPDGVLLPGMTVLASIVTQRVPAAATVPLAALRYKPKAYSSSRTDGEKQADSLWVLRAGEPTALPVVKGIENGSNVAVTSDELRSDDMVIVRDNGLGAYGNQVRMN